MLYRMIDEIDPDAFVTQSQVMGVFGKGFDKFKVKHKTHKRKKQQVPLKRDLFLFTVVIW